MAVAEEEGRDDRRWWAQGGCLSVPFGTKRWLSANSYLRASPNNPPLPHLRSGRKPEHGLDKPNLNLLKEAPPDL